MGRIGRGISGTSDVADHVSAFHHLSVAKTILVAVEVRVVIRECLARIELVNRKAARLAREQLLNASVFHGTHFCAARSGVATPCWSFAPAVATTSRSVSAAVDA